MEWSDNVLFIIVKFLTIDTINIDEQQYWYWGKQSGRKDAYLWYAN